KNPVDKQWHTVTSQADFDTLIQRIGASKHFVIDTETTDVNWQHAELVGLSFALQSHEAYYVPVAHVDEMGNRIEQLAREDILAQLKPILQNPQIGKIGQHLKYDAHILANYDIDLINEPSNWAMDTMLASYVINAVATRHGMDDLARHYLHTQTITFEDVAGKGAKQITFDKVPLTVASDYACEDADITYQLFELFSEKLKAEPNNAKLLHELEIPVAQILCQMEHDGILLNKAFLGELSARFDEKIQALEKVAFAQAGETFNLASPKQLGEVLFDRLGITGGKKTKTGQYSTSEAVLATIDHPLIETVLEHRSLSKLKSTYTDALANVADNNDRVHTSYH
ncbi:MAG: DNA polymerase I, partial [Moraxella osloensis]|nr:DNA polymerase I [Moraxella osloensis]